MTLVGGMLWWTVLGALLGWVAAWWLGRSTQRLLTEPVIRIVERQLDNPQHVMRITALERDLQAAREKASAVPTLEARIAELEAAPPKVVEKNQTRVVDRIVERVVEKPVDRPVPDLAALAERDAVLRAGALRIEHLEAMTAVLAERVAAAVRPAATTGAPPAAVQADDAARPLRQRIEHLEALAAVQAERLAETLASANADLRSGATADAAPRHAVPAARDAGIELVEGIGPKIAELLRARGLGSFGALANASPGTLREILDDSGPAYRIADPSTWPEQARLAADGRWDELRTLQDSLNAGRRTGDQGEHA
ncbi:MAG: hypothetical protein RJA99_2393 [Pseudomonadota bacterium]|jgi:predicted flap endonuclease-1-like 5' DNA nuclease